MADNITCPRCKSEQARSPRCVSCGLDFRKYAEHIKKKREASAARNVSCPHCKARQPLSDACTGCGLDFRAYSAYVRRKKAGEDVEPPKPPADFISTPNTAYTNNLDAGGDEGENLPEPITEPGASRPADLEEIFKRAWEMFKKRWLTLVALNVLYIVSIIVSVLPVIAIAALFSTDQDPVKLAILSGFLGLFVFFVAFAAMGVIFAAATDESLTIGGALRVGVRRAPAFIWVMLLQGFIVIGGLMLFIVPGFIFMTWFLFSPYMVFAENARGINALLKSREYVRGHGWDVFFKLVVIWVIYMAVGFVPLIGMFVGASFMLLFIVMMYRDMSRLKGLSTSYPTDRWSRLKWPMAGLAGHVLPVAMLVALLVPLISSFEGADIGISPDMFSSQNMQQRHTVLATDKESYHSDQEITVTYSGMPGNNKDWVTLVGVKAPKDTYGELLYTEGRTDGSFKFKGLEPGQYEARAFHDWPNGGYDIKSRHGFEVKALGPGDSTLMRLKQENFAPGDLVHVSFRVPEDFPIYGWAGIVPSALPHGDESLNRSNTSFFKLLGGETSGELTFDAPMEPGTYDVRLHDREGGKEVFHVSFSVSRDASPAIVQLRATSESSMKVMVYVYSLNYNGSIKLNGHDLYTMGGERDMNYNHTTTVILLAGKNEFEVSFEAIPDAWKNTLRIKVYTETSTGSGKKEKVIAKWNVFAPSGIKRFIIELEGAGVRATLPDSLRLRQNKPRRVFLYASASSSLYPQQIRNRASSDVLL